MKIAVIGGTGFIGSQIVKAGINNKHQIISISRKGSTFKHKDLKEIKFDIFNEDLLLETLKSVDYVISAYNPSNFHINQEEKFVTGYEKIIEASKKAGKPLLIVVGATVLLDRDNYPVYEGFYPPMWIKSLRGILLVYNKYKDIKDLDLTFFAPAAEVIDGKITNNYAYSEKNIVENANFNSVISRQDIGEAIIKEAVERQYKNKLFTIGYK